MIFGQMREEIECCKVHSREIQKSCQNQADYGECHRVFEIPIFPKNSCEFCC